MVRPTIVVDNCIWKVYPTGRITVYGKDEFGLLFELGTGPSASAASLAIRLWDPRVRTHPSPSSLSGSCWTSSTNRSPRGRRPRPDTGVQLRLSPSRQDRAEGCRLPGTIQPRCSPTTASSGSSQPPILTSGVPRTITKRPVERRWKTAQLQRTAKDATHDIPSRCTRRPQPASTPKALEASGGWAVETLPIRPICYHWCSESSSSSSSCPRAYRATCRPSVSPASMSNR